MALNEHRIPSCLAYAGPWAVFFGFKWLTYRRNWLISRKIKAMQVDCVLDFGAGEGFWLRYAQRMWPHCRWVAVEPNVDLADFVAATSSAEVWAEYRPKEWGEIQGKASKPAIWLFSVLPYLPEPEKCLADWSEHSQMGTELYIYQPIHERQLIGLYRRWFNRGASYETAQGRRNRYDWKGLQALLQQASWQVVESEPIYGTWGILSHELWGMAVLLFGKKGWRWAGLLGMLLLWPFVLLLAVLDAIFPPKSPETANGVWVRAIKAKP